MNGPQQSLLASRADAGPGHLPGDLAMWVFIVAELLVFGLLFISLAFARTREPEVFAAGAATVHTGAGLLNTLILLTGSYFVALGVQAVRGGALEHCSRWLLAGAGTGVAYTGIKFSEYAQLVSDGYNLRSSSFHFFYFFTTFFHLMHVVLGMIILVAVAQRCRQGLYSAADHRGVESGASYWHMVDLVWLVLFPLVYVLL